MIKISIETLLTPEYQEKLEEKLAKLLMSEGLNARIDDDDTGNTTIISGRRQDDKV